MQWKLSGSAFFSQRRENGFGDNQKKMKAKKGRKIRRELESQLVARQQLLTLDSWKQWLALYYGVTGKHKSFST